LLTAAAAGGDAAPEIDRALAIFSSLAQSKIDGPQRPTEPPPMRHLARLLVLSALGCSGGGATMAPSQPGSHAGSGGTTGSTSTAPPSTTPAAGGSPGMAPAPATTDDMPGPAPFRRLTALELDNTLRDLFGPSVMAQAQALLPPGIVGDLGFVDGTGPPSEGEVRGFGQLAAAAARVATADLPRVLPCQPVPTLVEQEPACVRAFIARFGLRVYRQPIDDSETENLVQLFNNLRSPAAGADFPTAIRLLLTAMLQSPFFLYHWEISGPTVREGTLVRLGPYQLASRLSYALTASLPDESLFTAAAANALTTPDQIETQVRRLLASDGARSAVHDFFAQTLDTQTLPLAAKEDPLFTPALARAMQDETDAFVDQLFVGPAAHARLEDLLTSPAAIVTPAVDKIYGAPSATALDRTQRAGVFTRLAFLAANATEFEGSIVRRGLNVFERLLCRELPPVPPNVEVTPTPDPDPKLSHRQQFEMFVANHCTDGCHDIYPLGWSFEKYDTVGRFVTTDARNGQPIDASGSIDLPSGPLKFDDALDMMKQLPARTEVQACMAKQWFRYLLRRKEATGDSASLAAAGKAFAAASFDVRELIVALAKSRAFTHRQPSTGEVLP
jgi:hypothetical protein